MARGIVLLWLPLTCCLVAVAPGCHANAPEAAPPEAPVIPVSHPVSRVVTDYVDFTGRTSAVESVNITPRVTGYLVRLPFKEGGEVKAGDLLFEVDPRPYKAQLDQAIGQVNLYEAQLRLAKATLARDLEVAKTPGAVSAEQLDQDRAAVDEADARVKAFQASTEVYKLNLEFTKVTSPIDGHVSRQFLTLGNLVNQDQTLLTTVVSQDPMYAFFDMDEPTLLRIRRAINQGRIKPPQDGKIVVYMGLQGEDGFPHQGTINFVNNQVNPATGSISVRGVFANPKPPNGIRLLTPGMFVRIRFPIGEPHPALLVIDRAIGSDQGLKFVYVVDTENKVQSRRVTTGAIQPDGLRAISEGVIADDWVVVGGIQQIRPRMTVQTEHVTMPSFSQPAAEHPVQPEEKQGGPQRTSQSGQQGGNVRESKKPEGKKGGG